MTRASLLYVVAFALAEAAAAAGPRRSEIPEAELLAGAALPLDAASVALASAEDAFALDAEMRDFVAPFKLLVDPSVKLRRLLEGMQSRGLFEMTYTDSYTRSASRTFHEREGNCLSFTMLFVGLARASGLDVRYQVVDVPPTWNNDLGLVVIGAHVNAAVSQRFIKMGRGGTELFPESTLSQKVIVDFNAKNFRGDYPSRIVNDRYVVALYYNNLGAEALMRRQYDASFALLREAIRVEPDVPAPWVNLGVLYSRHRLYLHAEAAYLRALDNNSREPSALANLVAVYDALGEKDVAAELSRKIQRYRDMNPYYHYARAQTAFDQRRYDDALAALRTAIRLKHDEDEFYELRGRTFAELGRPERAVDSFARAKLLEPTRRP
jgi:tetratricopeptide (TPR) repeat protein